MRNTANDIETLGDDKGFAVTVDGSDLNALEELAAAAAVVITYHGSEENLIEILDAAIPDDV